MRVALLTVNAVRGDPALTRRSGQQAREHALANFMEERFLKNMFSVYDRVIKER